LNMQVGNAFYLTQAVLLLFIAVVRKHYIGICTHFIQQTTQGP